jgi:hypothetical protein
MGREEDRALRARSREEAELTFPAAAAALARTRPERANERRRGNSRAYFT